MLVAALAVACIAGCGGGGDKSASTAATTAAQVPTVGATTPGTTPVTPPPTTPPSTSSTTPTSPPAASTPESPPKDGGGQEPARTELEFTASSAGFSPKQASVAPFISVKVTLRSKDGSSHKLVIDGKTLAVGGTRKSAFVTLPGLPAGRSYKGQADGTTTVRILSASEPGP